MRAGPARNEHQVLVVDAAPTANSVRAEATALYKKRQYVKACAHFEKALMLGKKENALATFRRALNSGGQPQVKANVYFNLGKLGVETPQWMQPGKVDVGGGGRYEELQTDYRGGCEDVVSTDSSCTNPLKLCITEGHTAATEDYGSDTGRFKSCSVTPRSR